MQCVKTGFHGYVESHGLFCLGDAYKVGDVYLFKCFASHVGREPMRDFLNYKITEYDVHFHLTEKMILMVVHESKVKDFGYDGVSLKEAEL